MGLGTSRLGTQGKRLPLILSSRQLQLKSFSTHSYANPNYFIFGAHKNTSNFIFGVQSNTTNFEIITSSQRRKKHTLHENGKINGNDNKMEDDGLPSSKRSKLNNNADANAEMKANLPLSEHSNPVLDEANGVVKLVRDEQPEHCIFTIKSLSVLQDALSNSDKDHINSMEFIAGGYTWVLSVYPNGNKQEDGDGHLSLYVTLVNKLDSITFLHASLRFFIYDQIRKNYLTFIDVGEKSFHALKTSRGIPKVLPLATFTDPSNGFLVNDCCIFGAGIFLRDGRIKRSIVSPLEIESQGTYTWKITNFSDFSRPLSSPIFSFGGWSWKLSLYPRGCVGAKGKDLSLYLKLVNAKELTNGKDLYTQYRLCIKNQYNRGQDQKFIGNNWFNSETNSWGYTSFMSISDLYNTSRSFLVDDTLIVEVNIQVMVLLQDTNKSPGE